MWNIKPNIWGLEAWVFIHLKSHWIVCCNSIMLLLVEACCWGMPSWGGSNQLEDRWIILTLAFHHRVDEDYWRCKTFLLFYKSCFPQTQDFLGLICLLFFWDECREPSRGCTVGDSGAFGGVAVIFTKLREGSCMGCLFLLQSCAAAQLTEKTT